MHNDGRQVNASNCVFITPLIRYCFSDTPKDRRHRSLYICVVSLFYRFKMVLCFFLRGIQTCSNVGICSNRKLYSGRFNLEANSNRPQLWLIGGKRNAWTELKWECYDGSLVLPWGTGKEMMTSVASLEKRVSRIRYGRPGWDGMGTYNGEKRMIVSSGSWRQT